MGAQFSTGILAHFSISIYIQLQNDALISVVSNLCCVNPVGVILPDFLAFLFYRLFLCVCLVVFISFVSYEKNRKIGG